MKNGGRCFIFPFVPISFVCLVYLVYLVCLVCLVDLVYLVHLVDLACLCVNPLIGENENWQNK